MSLYSERIIAFLDILGWKELIQKSENNMQSLELVDLVAKSIEGVSKFVPNMKDVAKETSKNTIIEEPMKDIDFISTHFSDSIVFSSPNDIGSKSILISFVIGLSSTLAAVGCYVRGAITIGQLHHTQNVIYGPALIRAYELEQRNAIYPRVIITEDIADVAIKKEWVARDVGDNMLYLDILSETKKGDITTIETKLANNIKIKLRDPINKQNLAIIQKLNWFKNYLDSHKKNKFVST